MDNLPRLNESDEADRQGVFDLLGIFESILGINPQLSGHLISKTTFLTWLLKRMEAKVHEANRGYAAEILSILLDTRDNKLAFGKADGIESSLKVLSVSYILPDGQADLLSDIIAIQAPESRRC